MHAIIKQVEEMLRTTCHKSAGEILVYMMDTFIDLFETLYNFSDFRIYGYK